MASWDAAHTEYTGTPCKHRGIFQLGMPKVDFLTKFINAKINNFPNQTGLYLPESETG